MSTNPLHSQHIVMMGVCGCGKSTIGSVLADKLGWVFFDGDDFHSIENIQKMQAGIPLTDEDRYQWLQLQQEHLVNLSARRVSSVLACSALKAQYRQIIAGPFLNHEITDSNISFVLLAITYENALQRLKKRKQHFMNKKLLQSQFDTLEPPQAHREHISCYHIDTNTNDVESIVDTIITELSA